MRITNDQKKINMAILCGLIIVFFLWLYIYLPTRNRIAILKIASDDISNQIEQIEKTIPQFPDNANRLEILAHQHKTMVEKFSRRPEDIMQELTALAKENDINIKSMYTLSNRDDHQKIISVNKNDSVVKVPITLKIESKLTNFLVFLESIKKYSESFIVVENIMAHKEYAISEMLNISLQLSIHVLNEQ